MGTIKVNLNTIGSGVLAELFEEDFSKILDNIGDENTKAEAVRELTLKIKIRPSENRGDAEIMITSSAKLAPVKPHKGILFMRRQSGKVVAFEPDTVQEELPNIGIVKEAGR